MDQEQTFKNKTKIKATLKLAEQFTKDPQKADRLNKHHCLVCYYSPRIVMHAFSTVNCQACLSQITFSNSFTDKFCVPCAKSNKCCAHCGGDVEL